MAAPHSSGGDTPLMKQYWELKAQAGDALMLFRMGDFYELFGDDAVEAARILEITLTSRDKGKANAMPMAGVPHHSIQGYIQRLLKNGKKVAIADQVSEPTGKGIVSRELTRIFTPAVQFEPEGTEANYLAVALREREVSAGADLWRLACLDASTGETLISDALTEERLSAEIAGLPIRHLIRVAHDLPEAALPGPGTLIEDLPGNYLSFDQAAALLKTHYGLAHLDTFLGGETSIRAMGIIVTYALRSQRREKLEHLRLPAPLHAPQTLELGPRSAQHLDLLPAADGTPSLFALINRTRTSLGARRLRGWLLEPLKSADAIRTRQEAVRELADTPSATSKLGEALTGVYDLDRILGRVSTGLANPRDTLALGKSIAALPDLGCALAPLASTQALGSRILEAQAELGELATRILTTQRDDAPLIARDGGIFAKGTTPELDRLITLSDEGERWLIDLETREREATRIPSLKVRYNRVFGYYIEVTQAHLKSVPSHYQRKQTTVGAERFFTEELKKFEDEIVTAESRRKALELQLFTDLLEAIRARTASIMKAATAIGETDALLALARVAQEPGWVFPVIDESMDLEIEAGRHPMVDAMSRGTFVPNDLHLSADQCLTLLITGPNMGGKSTVMRQVALIVILGQMGAPVPATRARWGAFTQVHTRIGAHDAIARGQSTFMVEMSELAHILHHADSRALIVLDEIGRGTSTYDGISVAWSTLEWLARKVGARTLFATHYHELTRLEGQLPGVANAHMGVETSKGAGQTAALRFLYKLQPGPTAESFGVHVASLAGLPKPVVDRAWKVLEELEAQHAGSGADSYSAAQLSLFSAPRRDPELAPRAEVAPAEPHPVVRDLSDAKLDEMTPIQALNFLAALQGQLQERAKANA